MGLLTTGDRREIDAAVERCVAGSLLTWSLTEDALIMHRPLGRVLRERDQALGRLTMSIATALDLREPRIFSVRQAWSRRKEGAQVVGQIEALRESARAAGVDLDLHDQLLWAASWRVQQLIAAADIDRAIAIGIQTLADHERVLGPDDLDTLNSRNDLAGAYRSAGRLGEAIRRIAAAPQAIFLVQQGISDVVRATAAARHLPGRRKLPVRHSRVTTLSVGCPPLRTVQRASRRPGRPRRGVTA